MIKHTRAWLATVVLTAAIIALAWQGRPADRAERTSLEAALLARTVAVEFSTLLATLDPLAAPGPQHRATRGALVRAVEALSALNTQHAIALRAAARDGLALVDAVQEQSALLRDELAALRSSGPEAVLRLREDGLAREADQGFGVLTRTIHLAQRGVAADPGLADEVGELLDATEGPASFGRLLRSAAGLIDVRTRVEAEFEALAALPVPALAEQITAPQPHRLTGAYDRPLWLGLVSVALLATFTMLHALLRSSRPGLSTPLASSAARSTGEDELALRLAEQLTALDQAIADLETAQEARAEREHAADMARVASRLRTRMQIPLWYLRSNTELIDQRLNVLALFVTEAAGTIALFDGDQNDRRRIAEGLTRLRRLLKEQRLDDTLMEVDRLLKDNAAGIEELAHDTQAVLSDLQSAGRLAPVDLATLVARARDTWCKTHPLVEVECAIPEPVAALVSATPMTRAVQRAFTALSAPAAVTPPYPVRLEVVAHRGDDEVSLEITSDGAGTSIPAAPLPSSARLSEGSGDDLDIIIAARLAEAAGGTFRAEPPSRVVITLPLSPSSPAAAPQSAAYSADAIALRSTPPAADDRASTG